MTRNSVTISRFIASIISRYFGYWAVISATKNINQVHLVFFEQGEVKDPNECRKFEALLKESVTISQRLTEI